MIYKKIVKCRVCGNKKLKSVINLGKLALTGIFPDKNEEVNFGPLELIKCDVKNNNDCGLLQLHHNYNLDLLYGDNYGYRSGLNESMVNHLNLIVKQIEKIASLKDDDLVIDIGSNDGTLLKSYKNIKLQLVGIDPTIKKFKQFYPPHIKCIADFFSDKLVHKFFKKKAKIITSIAMFYDLESPIQFMKQIENVLRDDGLWVIEQCYMPNMITKNAYDTICHEHLEYYALKQIKWMADKVNLKIIKVETNETNGASFLAIFAKKNSDYVEDKTAINRLLKMEQKRKLDEVSVYKNFYKKIVEHKVKLKKLINEINKRGEKVFGYGASTKGNVILQFCELTKKDIPYIAEVNEYKFGKQTPATKIPIISEKEAVSMNPNYYLVLPWHFKENIIKREKKFLQSGGHLIFPLPELEII